jgi:K+ transporter
MGSRPAGENGNLFSPVIVAWFVVIGLLGVPQYLRLIARCAS